MSSHSWSSLLLCVPADIADKELKSRREARWEIAFAEDPAKVLSNSKEDMDRKATIVFEYIIQASDVCHVRRCLSSEQLAQCSPVLLLRADDATLAHVPKMERTIVRRAIFGVGEWACGERTFLGMV